MKNEDSLLVNAIKIKSIELANNATKAGFTIPSNVDLTMEEYMYGFVERQLIYALEDEQDELYLNDLSLECVYDFIEEEEFRTRVINNWENFKSIFHWGQPDWLVEGLAKKVA